MLTRWWLIGACAVSFKNYILVWEKICSAIRNSAPSESTSMKIASCTLNLVKNDAVRSDLELIAVFHSWFLFPHFKFLQEGDPVAGGTPSFLARHITVRYFLTMNDLRIIDTGEFKTHKSFRDYNMSVDALSISYQAIAQKSSSTFSDIWGNHLLNIPLYGWMNSSSFLSSRATKPQPV